MENQLLIVETSMIKRKAFMAMNMKLRIYN